jgi:hypothetical protein
MDGVFSLPSETLAELEKARIFTQKPSVDSLTKALHAEGALVTSPDGNIGILCPKIKYLGVNCPYRELIHVSLAFIFSARFRIHATVYRNPLDYN